MPFETKLATPVEVKARRERLHAAVLLVLLVVVVVGAAASALWLLWPYIQRTRPVAYVILGLGVAYAIFYRIVWLPEIRGRRK